MTTPQTDLTPELTPILTSPIPVKDGDHRDRLNGVLMATMASLLFAAVFAATIVGS